MSTTTDTQPRAHHRHARPIPTWQIIWRLIRFRPGIWLANLLAMLLW